MAAALAAALFSTAAAAGGSALAPKGPIVITSETLSAEGGTNTAVFEGSVVARTGDVTLYADRMTVSYLPEGGGVRQIDAEGRVKLVRGRRVVTSGKAVYYGEERKIIFTEGPRAVEGANVITGSRMTYLMDEDRSIVEDSKVFLEPKD
jgi:lipopolysaccharide export system protein LptA